MLRHVVMWKFHDEALGKSRAENAQIMKSKLEALVGVIPQIKYLEVGINENPNEHGFDAILISDFESFEDLHIYKVHPAHQEVSKFCQQIRISRESIDFTKE